ncbi:hypothetical protein FHG87_010682 [Trinorchestia longiramus]|nr:hypothetical protein FHG87_010682 [Trinorchestia longiramus]
MVRCYHLPLLVLLVAAAAAKIFRTVLRDTALSPTLSMIAPDICSCRSQCNTLNDCTAAAYDKGASLCNMTNMSLQDVALHEMTGTIALLTFGKSCSNGGP